MTNPLKGEITFEAGGKTYTFKIGTAAHLAIEAKTKTPLHRYLSKEALAAWGVTELMLFFSAGLLRAHPSLTERDVAMLLDEIGFDRAGEIVGQALVLAFGEADKTAANPTPPKANDGIGLHS